MKISQVGINLIKSFEGCSLVSYLDAAKVWTIGYGHTYNVRQGKTITQAQADQTLVNDIQIFEDGVNQNVHVPLNQYQFDALVSFCFNVGVSAFKTSTLVEKLNKGDYAGAAEQFALWIHAGGKVLQGLVTRRKAEMALFLKPVEVSQPKPQTPKPVIVNYTVQAGDNLSKIAGKFNTTVAYLLEINGWIKNPNFIDVGWKVSVPSNGQVQTPKLQNYTIRSGENLSVIAKRFDTTVENLLHLNPWIKNRNLIQAGWDITVPAK